MQPTKSSAILTALLILTIIGASGLGYLVLTRLASSQTNTLPTVEIKDYKGEKLGSINDFRENSISGPQQINIETYRLVITGLVGNAKAYTYDQVVNDP